MADENTSLRDRITGLNDRLRGSQFMESVLRPGSPFKKGYSDSPRNRSYVIMNNVLYHLHPAKVKRHGVKLSYTLCLGGLSFFLFILLTITGIFLMFYYTPTADPGLRRRPGPLHQRRFRIAGAQHAPLGCPPDGADRLPPHEPRASITAPTSHPVSSTGWLASSSCCSPCCCPSPATCSPGTSWRCGPSPSAPTWPAMSR